MSHSIAALLLIACLGGTAAAEAQRAEDEREVARLIRACLEREFFARLGRPYQPWSLRDRADFERAERECRVIVQRGRRRYDEATPL